MMSAKKPENESERLEALRAHGVLDTAPEREFDDAVTLASFICKAPVSLVSFVDDERQWFKARVGLDVQETPRDIAFCAHTVRENRLFVVGDARADPRFADNPLVTAGPLVRFYAGVPIRTADGAALGTLCVLDHVPRALDAAQESALGALARQVESLLEARKRARDAESRERRLRGLEVLVRKTNDAYLQVGPDGVIVGANLAATVLYGYATDELVGSRFDRLARPPEQAGAPSSESMRPLAPSERGRFESVHYTKRGTPVNVELSVSEAGEGNEPYVVVVRDISDRVAALREAQLTRMVTEHLPDAVVVIAEGGTIQRWNKAAENLYGRTAAEAIGQPSTIMHPPELREAQSKAVRAAIRETGLFRAEVVGLHESGAYLPIESAIRMMQDSTGENIFVAINRDLREQRRLEAERRQAELAVFASNELFRTVFDEAAAGMLIAGLDGRIQRVNGALVTLLGVDAVDIVGAELAQFTAESELERARELLGELVQREAKSVQLETVVTTRRGPVPVIASVSVVKDISGASKLFAVQLQDISARKAAETALVAAKEAAESANRAKSVFLGSMSHELRTPLHAILGFGRVLEKERHGPLNDQQRQYVRDILESGSHMLGLVEELLELRKVEEGRSQSELHEVELGAAAEEAVRMTHELARKKGHDLRITASPRPVRLIARHRELVQVLVNLISNAIKYTPAGGHVRLHWEVGDAEIAVHVDDDGVGMTAEEQGRLFRDFERLGRSSRGDSAGTGLGLALTRRIVEELGGGVSVTSAPGRGSRFTFTLPCVSPTCDREPTASKGYA